MFLERDECEFVSRSDIDTIQRDTIPCHTMHGWIDHRTIAYPRFCWNTADDYRSDIIFLKPSLLKSFLVGTSFHGNMCDYDIQIGSSYHCPIINMSTTQLICEITAGSMLDPRTSQDVRVARHHQGYLGARYRMQFQLQAAISNITPMIGNDFWLTLSQWVICWRSRCLLGSIYGGTRVTIDGDGFIANNTLVGIAGTNYTYVGSTSYSQIIFTTLPQLTYVDVNLSLAVSVGPNLSVCRLSLCYFSWALRATAYFDSVSPSIVRGPTNLTIIGRNLLAGGNATTAARVSINGNPCNITAMANESVTCIVAGVEAGRHPVVGSIDGLFFHTMKS